MINAVQSIDSNDEYIEQHNYHRTGYIIFVLQEMDLSSMHITKEDELIRFYEFLHTLNGWLFIKY